MRTLTLSIALSAFALSATAQTGFKPIWLKQVVKLQNLDIKQPRLNTRIK